MIVCKKDDSHSSNEENNSVELNWNINTKDEEANNIVIKNLLEVYNVGQILTNCLFCSVKYSLNFHHPRVEADCNFYPLKKY